MESRLWGKHLLGPWPSTPKTKYIWGRRHPQAKQQTCPAPKKSIADLKGPKLRKRKSYSIPAFEMGGTLKPYVGDLKTLSCLWKRASCKIHSEDLLGLFLTVKIQMTNGMSHVEQQKKMTWKCWMFLWNQWVPGPEQVGSTHLYSQVCFMLQRPRLERHHQKTPRTGWCLRYPGCTVVRFPALHHPGKVQRQCLTTGLWPRSVVGIWNHQWNRPALLNSSIRNCLNTLVL